MAAAPAIFDLAAVISEAGFGDLALELVAEAGADVVEPDPDAPSGERRRAPSEAEQVETVLALLRQRLTDGPKRLDEAEAATAELMKDGKAVAITFGDGEDAFRPMSAERGRVAGRLSRILQSLATDLGGPG